MNAASIPPASAEREAAMGGAEEDREDALLRLREKGVA
jgi:hypothetical protein